jgi:hypothetical protein
MYLYDGGEESMLAKFGRNTELVAWLILSFIIYAFLIVGLKQKFINEDNS